MVAHDVPVGVQVRGSMVRFSGLTAKGKTSIKIFVHEPCPGVGRPKKSGSRTEIGDYSVIEQRFELLWLQTAAPLAKR
jgi:hypothetical protein